MVFRVKNELLTMSFVGDMNYERGICNSVNMFFLQPNSFNVTYI